MLTTSEIFHDTRILNEAATLSNHYNVKILAKKYSLKKANPVKSPFEIKLVDYSKVPINRLNIFSGQFALIKAAFRENPDVYHAHDLDGLLCAFLAALFKRKILVYDSHEFWSDTFPFTNIKGIQWLLGPLEKFLMFKVKAGITVNDSIAHLLEKKYHKSFISLRNFPNTIERKKSSLNLKSMFPGKKIVLHFGSAVEGRGHEQIIEAAKYLPKNILIVFLEVGSFGNYFKSKVSKMGLANQIFFLPPVAPAEIIESCKHADLGLVLHQKVSLSYYHALPNKIFQYIAAEVPVLGSNFPEMKKIIVKNKIGEVVDPARVNQIATKIKTMLLKENQIKYRHNLKGLIAKYSWQSEGKKLVNFYESSGIFSEPEPIVSRRFKIDVLWNSISLVFLGLSGLIFNLIVARAYGREGLGTFNEVYAIYILASQLAVGSVHLSVQKHLPAFLEQKKEIDKITSAGLFLTLFFSLIVGIVIYFSRNLWGLWFKNPDVSIGVGLIAFGLVGFALNKTLLAVLNGLRLMRPFAFFTGLRYLLILGFIITLVALHAKQSLLPLAFSLTEVSLLIVLLIYNGRFFNIVAATGKWLKKHFVFGYHSLMGNVLLDVNTRVDVLILGFFTSAKVVGLYSFPALLIEGLGQLLGNALKLNVNPVLAKFSVKTDRKVLESYVRKGVRLTYVYFSIIGFSTVLIYPIFIRLFLPGTGFIESWPIMAVLLGGLTLSSGYQPFQMLLAQTGFPKLYSRLIAAVFLVNVFLNLILVPVLGILGSAMATAVSFIVLALFNRFLARKALKIKI